MKQSTKLPLWFLGAALLTALTIIAHELAHYVAAIVMRAENVKLHWADITFTENSLNSTGLAVTWIAGPLLTHGIIVWVWLSKRTDLLALALGLGACSRNLVLLPFTIKFLFGRDVSTFTNDEVTVAEALGISPIGFAVVAVLLGVGGTIVFLKRAYASNGVLFPIALLLGTIAGIILWGTAGPALLPGGKGFE